MEQATNKGFAEVHFLKADCHLRTEGDGMENIGESSNDGKNLNKQNEAIKTTEYLRDKLIYNPEDFKHIPSKPPLLTGRIVQLRPTPIVLKAPKPDQKFNMLQGKEPKFVPYEPYKGAVIPMVPSEKIIRRKKTKKMSLSSLTEPILDENKELRRCSSEDLSLKLNQAVLINNEKIEKELEKLQKENQQLENQLKFQVQVNGDLKNLLVASVGEDMETRVHILTEDKLHLARALLNSAQKLNTHQEQTEWLASQCEVWRSKFLASSIMVEELAKWKALLTRRVQDLHDTTKNLLKERTKVREYLISTYKDLSVLCDNFDVTCLRSGVHKLNSSSVLDLSELDMQLSAVVRLQLLGNGLASPPALQDPGNLEPYHTAAELTALELIKNPVPELENADAAYSAVMGAAINLSSSSHIFSPACCGHCTGEIKTI